MNSTYFPEPEKEDSDEEEYKSVDSGIETHKDKIKDKIRPENFWN